MTTSFDKVLDQAYRGRSLPQILDASPAALLGVTAADADHLDAAFGITDIRRLAECKYFHRAGAILAAEGKPAHDPGPPPAWEDFFAGAPLNYYVQHPAGRFRLDFGPVYYRGRLDGSARVIVVGQDPSTNEILAHRVFVGTSGQRVQGLLKKLGLTRSYVLMNTFLFSVFGQFDTALRNISLEPTILDYRNAFLDRLAAENPIQAVITMGAGARHAVENWPGAINLQVFDLVHPAAPEATVTASWNQHLPGLQAAAPPDDDGQADPNPYGATFTPPDEVAIPRFDLPFGVPDWHGVGGGHSHRDRNNQKKIIWTAP